MHGRWPIGGWFSGGSAEILSTATRSQRISGESVCGWSRSLDDYERSFLSRGGTRRVVAGLSRCLALPRVDDGWGQLLHRSRCQEYLLCHPSPSASLSRSILFPPPSLSSPPPPPLGFNPLVSGDTFRIWSRVSTRRPLSSVIPCLDRVIIRLRNTSPKFSIDWHSSSSSSSSTASMASMEDRRGRLRVGNRITEPIPLLSPRS